MCPYQLHHNQHHSSAPRHSSNSNSNSNQTTSSTSNDSTRMKFSTTLLSLLPAALTLAAPSGLERRQSSGSSTLSYDPRYDVGGTSLNDVSCSTGDFGLITEGFTNFQSLPTFPLIGGTPTIAGFNSPQCGACYEVSYTSATGARNSITMIGIDASPGGFNVGQRAMDQLTGNRAVELGRVDVTWEKVSRDRCGLSPRE